MSDPSDPFSPMLWLGTQSTSFDSGPGDPSARGDRERSGDSGDGAAKQFEAALARAWKKFAPLARLRFQRSDTGFGPTLRGERSGTELCVWTETLGDPAKPRWVTAIDARHAGAAWPELRVRNETDLTRLAKRLGLDFTDLRFGNATFDDKFHVKAADEHTARRLLTSDVQQRLCSLAERATLTMSNDTIHLE